MHLHLHSGLVGNGDTTIARAARTHERGLVAALAALLVTLPLALSADSREALPSLAVAPDVALERLGEPTIEDANNYSENTRVRIRLVYPAGHPQAGQVLTSYSEPIRIEEWNTQIYDGLYGATLLPMVVHAPGGEVEVVLKSLARYSMFDLRNMPVPQIAAHAGQRTGNLQIPQWVDADGNEKTDWLEHRVDDILRLARASPEAPVAEAAAALERWEQSYKRDCGGFDQERPRLITVSAACLDWDGRDSHRVNRDRELTATVLHELRHVWGYAHSTQDARKRRLPKAQPVPVEPLPCRAPNPQGADCSGQTWLADPRYTAQEADAEAFADRYKHLFP